MNREQLEYPPSVRTFISVGVEGRLIKLSLAIVLSATVTECISRHVRSITRIAEEVVSLGVPSDKATVLFLFAFLHSRILRTL